MKPNLGALFALIVFGGSIHAAAAGVMRLPSNTSYATFYTSPTDSELWQAAKRYRMMIVETTSLRREQIASLRDQHVSVLGYLNFSAVENNREWYQFKTHRLPDGLKFFKEIFPDAERYQGWSNEYWANLSNHDYQKLVLDYIAPSIAKSGVNGFFLDNMDLMEHERGDNGRCDSACKQGGVELLASLRHKYPNFVIVENNAFKIETLERPTLGNPRVKFGDLIDGVYRESLFSKTVIPAGKTEVADGISMPVPEGEFEDDLSALKMAVRRFPHLWIGIEEFVQACPAFPGARVNSSGRSQYALYARRASSANLNLYVSTQGQELCFW